MKKYLSLDRKIELAIEAIEQMCKWQVDDFCDRYGIEIYEEIKEPEKYEKPDYGFNPNQINLF